MRSLVLTGGVLMLAAACSGTPASQTLYGSNGPPPHLAVAAIELRPNQASLTVSKTTRFVAVPKDASGNALSGRTVQWSSTDSAIATVSDSGVVKGLSVGSAGIMATSEGVSAAAALTVANAPVASVIVSIDSPSLTVGQGTQATATEKDASGNILTGRTVSFASSNPGVATISSTGYVTSVGAGTAVISATSEGVSGSATMIVSAPSPAPVASVAVSLNSASLTVGQGTQAVVTLKDASGNTLSGRAIAFASSNSSVATISATGAVTAVSAGTSVITATSEAVSGSATLTVTAAAPAPVASVSVTLNSGSLTVGQTTQAVVTLKDASGNTLGGRAITYSSGNTNVATVSSTGTVTAVAAGSTVITATSEGVSGTATVTVTPPPVASVTVTLNSSSITAGQTTQAVVTLKDANGNTLIGRAITFASSNAIVATVSGAGTVTGVSAGSAGITATSEGVSGSSTLTVTAAPVASVTVTLNSSSLTVGQSTQAVAVTKDGSGNTLTGRTITYSSSNTSVATVSGTGLVSALAAGSAVITATSEGVSGTAPLTVTSVPVASVTVTLNSNSLTVGQSTQAVVVLKDANGNTLTGRTTTYASSNTGIATVTGAGLVSAVAAGTTQIVATSEGISGSATLTVQAAPATKLAILTQPSTAAQSGAALAQQPALQLRDASNTPVNQGGLVVTAAIGSGSGGTLGGTTTATTNASGVAQFTNLTLTGSGSYTLLFTSPGLTSATSATISVSAPQEPGCAAPQPAWIWCDDFEQDRTSSYFEYVSDNNSFVRAAGVGRNGSIGMRARFAAGQVSAGALRLAFGKTPSPYFRAVDAGTANYRELYWRVYVKYQAGWTGGGGDKMTRAIVFANSNWSEAAIGHVWAGSSPNQNYLVLDPASGTTVAGTVQTVGYNDFAHLRWLGSAQSQTPLFDAAHVGQWYCVEAHMKLNTPGQSDGLFELRINGNLEAQRTGLNWLGSYQTYGINAVFLENYWNAGSPQTQERYFDDFVVSTQPIGC